MADVDDVVFLMYVNFLSLILDTNQNQPTARALQLHQKDGKLVVGMVGIVLVFVVVVVVVVGSMVHDQSHTIRVWYISLQLPYRNQPFM